ncbi:hypothetical protein OPV22_031274 [Ensete ventricosum]|uniref:Uncharacterized protein n=1 Tax=Ensete ventricosum TaxID=4639 RepID=A0AAV8PNT3_ENSVE|nr:hypothetical protein OPV22_031274 [Ensete ventricosum]
MRLLFGSRLVFQIKIRENRRDGRESTGSGEGWRAKERSGVRDESPSRGGTAPPPSSWRWITSSSSSSSASSATSSTRSGPDRSPNRPQTIRVLLTPRSHSSIYSNLASRMLLLQGEVDRGSVIYSQGSLTP